VDPFIILGMDGADADLRAMLEAEQPIPGVWGEKIGDDILWNGARTQLQRTLGKVFVDLKAYDTKDRLMRIIAGYATLPHPPTLLSISGELNDGKAYKKIVAARGRVGILLTGPLSDWNDEFCLDKYTMTAAAWMDHVLTLAYESGAQGVTCPAWLLKDKNLKSFIKEMRANEEFLVVATGIRSKGVPKGNHKYPRTPEFAMRHGASLIVIESEVTSLPGREPLAQLKKIYDSVMESASA
jgi:orotidine-5'-phosphate decarboxylase